METVYLLQFFTITDPTGCVSYISRCVYDDGFHRVEGWCYISDGLRDSIYLALYLTSSFFTGSCFFHMSFTDFIWNQIFSYLYKNVFKKYKELYTTSVKDDFSNSFILKYQTVEYWKLIYDANFVSLFSDFWWTSRKKALKRNLNRLSRVFRYPRH